MLSDFYEVKPRKGRIPIAVHYHCFVLLTLLFWSVAFLQAEDGVAWTTSPSYETPQDRTKSTAFKISDQQGLEHTLYSESYAVLIIEGNYRGGGWTPVTDAAKRNETLLRTALESRGFHVGVWRDLTGTQLRTTLNEVFTTYGYKQNSRLFFYYYGHGHVIDREPDPNGPRAFLVPIDAPNPVTDEQGFYRVALPMTQIVEFAKQITVKHAFFAFEACRAGYLIATLSSPVLPRPLGYLLSNKIEVPVRQFLTAGSADEDVLASSPFTPMLVGAFEDGDSNHDGYVTGSEVLAYVSERIPQATKFQNPEYGSIPSSGGGDIVIGPADPSHPGPKVVSQKAEVANTTSVPNQVRAVFQFSGLPMNLSVKPNGFNYGFSSLEISKALRGDDVRLRRVQIEMSIRPHTPLICCDVWVLFGAHPFGFNPGAIQGSNPYFINPNNAVAPAQIRFVVGNGGIPVQAEGVVNLQASYDIENGTRTGNIDNLKEAFAPPLSLPNGLYAQVFLWNGNQHVDVDVDTLSVTVDGIDASQ